MNFPARGVSGGELFMFWVCLHAKHDDSREKISGRDMLGMSISLPSPEFFPSSSLNLIMKVPPTYHIMRIVYVH